MREFLKFYVNGRWVDPETPSKLDVINPATEKPCGSISLGNAKDVDKAVAAAKAAAIARAKADLAATAADIEAPCCLHL